MSEDVGPEYKFTCKMFAKLIEKGPMTKTTLSREIGSDPRTVEQRAKFIQDMTDAIEIINVDEGRNTVIRLKNNEKANFIIKRLSETCVDVKRASERKRREDRELGTETDGGGLEHGDWHENNDENDPIVPYYKKMVTEARDVRGPYTVSGTHRHRMQRVILKNGRCKYET